MFIKLFKIIFTYLHRRMWLCPFTRSYLPINLDDINGAPHGLYSEWILWLYILSSDLKKIELSASVFGGVFWQEPWGHYVLHFELTIEEKKNLFES